MVRVAGVDRELTRGERLVLRADAEIEPIQLAANDGGDYNEDRKKTGAAAADGGSLAGIGTTGWTAIGIVALAAGGIAAGVSLSDGDGPGS